MTVLLLVILFSCGENEEADCGSGEETILTLNNKEAAIQESGGQFFLYFEAGIETDSERLMETIHLLLPCNLQEQFKEDGLEVRVSGEVKENPGYSSHTNYTDFFITKIARD